MLHSRSPQYTWDTHTQIQQNRREEKREEKGGNASEKTEEEEEEEEDVGLFPYRLQRSAARSQECCTSKNL